MFDKNINDAKKKIISLEKKCSKYFDNENICIDFAKQIKKICEKNLKKNYIKKFI